MSMFTMQQTAAKTSIKTKEFWQKLKLTLTLTSINLGINIENIIQVFIFRPMI